MAGNVYVTSPQIVNPDGTTSDSSIQRGIDAVPLASGWTVNVEAGTYNERLTVNKSLTLKGAQYGVDARSSRAGTESIIDISAMTVTNPNVLLDIASGADGVTVDGFTLIDSGTFHYADEDVIRVGGSSGTASNVAIRNNVINGYTGINPKTVNGLTVSSNLFTVNKNGIVVQGAGSDVHIDNNTFAAGSAMASDAAAIYITGLTVTNTISGNQITGFTGGNAIGGSGNHNLTISGNSLTGNKRGVNLWGNTTNIVINGGNVIGNNSTAGIEIKGQDITIGGNTITGNATGVIVNKNSINTSGVSVSGNTITGNTTGVQVKTVDAAVSVANNNFDGTIDNGTDLRIESTGLVAIGAGNQFAGNTYFIDNRSSQPIDLTSYTSANVRGSQSRRSGRRFPHRRLDVPQDRQRLVRPDYVGGRQRVRHVAADCQPRRNDQRLQHPTRHRRRAKCLHRMERQCRSRHVR